MKNIVRFAIAGLFCVAASVRAQPLVDHVPENTLLYVGWAGADNVGSRYDGSHLKAVLDQSRIRDLFGPYLNQLEQQIVKREPQAREGFRIVRTLGAPMWRYPSAISFGIDTNATARGKAPPLRFAIVSRAGADAPKLAEEITKLIANAPKGGPPVHAIASGDLVVFSVGYDDPKAAVVGGGGAALSKSRAFTDALAQVRKEPLVITYVNTEAAARVIEAAVQRSGDAKDVERVKNMLDASGLRGWRGYISAAGFDGKDWVSESFVAAPAPRSGLLAAWPDGAADASLLKSVPADSTFFTSVRFDPAKFVREGRITAARTDEQAGRGFDMGLGALQQALGTNVLENVLEPLGSDWVVYTSPTAGSTSLMGLIVVNKPDDVEKLRKSLNTASVNLANWINIGISKASPEASPGGVSIKSVRTKIGEIELTYLATPLITPTWAISEGRLYLGLYPQTVASAARQAKRGGSALIESEKYQTLLKRLNAVEGGGAATATSLATYYDLPTSARYGPMYTTLLAIGRYVGVADLFGPPLPEPLLPPLDVLLEQLAPAGSISWTDAAGWHTRSVVPFPGATVLSDSGAVIAGAGGGALGASILLPSLNRARETANRVKSQSNLRQIGLGLLAYANEHNGKLPDDLTPLMRDKLLTPEVFYSPRTGNSPHHGHEGHDHADHAADDAAHQEVIFRQAAEQGDYVYIGKGLTNTATAETVVAYERPEGLDDGINILFGDGHVEFYDMDAALELIDKQKKERGIE